MSGARAQRGPSEGGLIVVKIGGALVADEGALAHFWPALRALQARAAVVLVHGGGQQASALAARLGHQPRLVQGRRVTTDLDLEIAQWAMRGAVNTQLVARAVRAGLPAVGLSGVDGGTLRVTRRPPWQIDGEEVDFGWVGEVDHVQTALLHSLLDAGHLPAVAPLGVDANGQVYNVNADTVALALADALGAEQLLLVTAAGGVRRDAEESASRLARCDAATFAEGAADGWIRGGMHVKLEVAFQALRAGIDDVFILPPGDLVAREQATRVLL